MLEKEEGNWNDYLSDTGILKLNKVSAFSYYWQRPAATEEAAFKAMVSHSEVIDFQYFGFAWATLIDGLKNHSSKTKEILLALNKACDLTKKGEYRRCTVAQHIHTLRYIEVFLAAGITDLFWSHATTQNREIQGIRIHPFPLYPAQAVSYSPSGMENKKYLANFIGAYNPSIYISNVREIIFNDAGIFDDLLIVKRDRWHFDREVYEEQIYGQKASNKQLSTEERMKKEYLDAIKKSWFTLCPTGSGPNSIRIFECLSLGSIPIILTRDLRLAGSKNLWERASIIEEDSENGYRRAIDKARCMSEVERGKRLKAGYDLFRGVNVSGCYAKLISKTMKK